MIDLDLIVLLDTINRRGTIASAAEELDRVPSALSYSIQKYEDRLGFALFRREGRGVRFTEAAAFLYERGLPLIQQAAQLSEEAETIAKGREPKLRIAVEAWLTIKAIAPALTELYEVYPDIEVHLHEEALNGTWEALIEGRVDVAVGAPTPRPSISGIQTDVIGGIDGVLVVSPEHPLVARTSKGKSRQAEPKPMPASRKHREFPQTNTQLSLNQLAEERWVILRDTSRGWVPRDVLGFTPKRRLMVGSMAEKIAAQRAGLGIGYLPRPLATPLVDAGKLVALEVSDHRAPAELLLAWRTDSRGQGLQQFIGTVRTSLNTTRLAPKQKPGDASTVGSPADTLGPLAQREVAPDGG